MLLLSGMMEQELKAQKEVEEVLGVLLDVTIKNVKNAGLVWRILIPE